MKKSYWVLPFLLLFHCSSAMAGLARAQWLNSSTIRLQLPPGLYVNSSTTQFSLVDSVQTLRAGTSISLPLIRAQGAFAELSAAHIPLATIDQLIRLPLKVVITNNNKQILDMTAIQYAGLLDENYFYAGDDLGGHCSAVNCRLKLWAPTAQNVRVLIGTESLPMIRENKGVWSLQLPRSYALAYYQYEVQVYQPLKDHVETSITTDPYSFSLSLGGTHSQLVDLDSAETTPAHWKNFVKPPLNSLKDSVIYELHVRDFSADDQSVPVFLRGTYLAFSEENSDGVHYLRSLAEAGLTHLHLLPFNDFGSVNEDKSQWNQYQHHPGDLQEPQSEIGLIRASDPFNWGYDPVHYFAPEGSYAVQGQGANRIREVRSMIQAINELGLRVVQDVVFNHTYQSGAEPFSVFDKIVPLYYYRVDDAGVVHKSSCCNDTASEHRMMEKLMIDSVVFWAKTYKLDGFRFDLMSFHSRATMEKLRDTVRSLTLQRDGVDGEKILFYGEGWSFGSFYDRFPREAMTVENSAGSGFGFFNDRLRDAVRGGTTNSAEKSDQGFATGLYFDFNHEPANRNTPTDLQAQRGKLLHLGDVIKVGLAGNLQDYSFREHLGTTIRSGDLRFRGTPVAFAHDTIETVNYVVAHDGYSLWDAIQAKAPFHTPYRSPATATAEDRQRMHQLALAIPLLGQGIPFFEGGTELLRSKNGDQDSYDSGDFFNRLDWTLRSNHWGEGLPPAWKNLNDWSFWQPRLQEPALKPSSALLAQTSRYFKALLRLRQSSDLFKLRTASEVQAHLKFIDNDQQAEPGLIAMSLRNHQESLLIFLNASREARVFQHHLLKFPWHVHPLLDSQVDPVLSQVVLNPHQESVQIPGRTTLVLRLNPAERTH
ncbi:alpha-1,6-glucosidase domain-containing protein [Bdellovibrio bacteriovorus]|uniref:alpha-1,6-glucosidase domain-containing protein n=1 Tax=Bdellovibrio bacteriovorus TaxID=959 RepID=UPI0035A66B8D